MALLLVIGLVEALEVVGLARARAAEGPAGGRQGSRTRREEWPPPCAGSGIGSRGGSSRASAKWTWPPSPGCQSWSPPGWRRSRRPREHPAGWRTGEVPAAEGEGPERPDADGGVGGEELDRDTLRVLGVDPVGEGGDGFRVGDALGDTLQHHRVPRRVGGDHAARVGGEVEHLAAARRRAEPERLLSPNAPDR